MNNSFELVSSMSPKIKNKLKPGERRFRRVAGASILALKRNIRRSSILDKSVNTLKNDNLNILETSSTLSTDSFPSLQIKESQNNSIIIISDSDTSLSSTHLRDKSFQSDVIKETEVDLKVNCLLPDDKLAAISDWITNINAVNTKNNTMSSVITELSTICGPDFSNECLPKGKGHAINSTFVNGHNKKFDEMFGQKDNFKLADETVNSSKENKVIEPFNNLIIEDSFEVLNESLGTRLKILGRNEIPIVSSNADNKEESKLNNKWRSTLLSEESTDSISVNVANELFKNLNIDKSFNTKIDNYETPLKNTSINKWKEIEISDDSGADESITENILDELYGNSWRIKKDLILPKTEPRKKVKQTDIRIQTNSESKPKFSLLYKNPYLDSEKSKSINLLNSIHKSRLIESANSASLAKVKALCDSDTNSENSFIKKVPNTKLNFDESSDDNEGIENGTKSKYFKTRKVYNNENVDINNVNIRIKHKSKKSDNSDSDIEFTFNKKVQISSKNSVNNRTKINNDRISSKSSDYSGNNTSSDGYIKVTETNKITSKLTKKSTIANSKSSDSNLNVPPKKKIESKILKPPSNDKIITSDDEWEDEVRGMERRLTIADNGTYSFLASLSANVPLSKCDASARIFRNNYKAYKDQLLKKLFKLYNKEVFDNVLSHDMLLEWGVRMRKTAGFCYCKKITRSRGTIERSARIVLSTKVLDTADRLRDTLIHEMCHAATWIVSGVSDGHGEYWKAWAFKAMKKFPEIPPIKRCHNYIINTKYTYKCTGCGYSIGRHSKSLDIEKKRCGYCYGKFEILINKTNKNGEIKAVAATPKKEPTGFAVFVKENYGLYKNPQLKHCDVMKVLGQKFKELQVIK